MRLKNILVLLIIILLVQTVFAADQKETLLLRTPSISSDHIVFVYAGDIWIADRDGQYPRRLTIHQGVESNPYISPDGKWVAFTGDYDGNTDVFIVPVEGGAPIRLTYHPTDDKVEGWTNDSKNVLFASSRDIPSRRYNRLHTVSIDGGLPVVLPMPMAEHGELSDDGKFIAYTPLRDAFGTWKRYRGGRTAWIWLFNFANNEVELIPRENSNDTYPNWVGDKVYFVSDRNFTMELFSYDTKSKAVKQITSGSDYDIKSLTSFGKELTYEREGRIFIYNTETGQTTNPKIYINPDLPEIRPSFVNAQKLIYSYEVSPTGKRGLFEARGDIFSVPTDKGDIRNLTNSPGVFDRHPVWSPDGAQIAYFSDQSGEYKLYIVDQKGEKEAKSYKIADTGFYEFPYWSPDGKYILFRNQDEVISYINLENGKIKRIDEDFFDITSMSETWAPDSKWIAYKKRIPSGLHAIFIYSLDKDKSYQLTDGMSDANNPAWSCDGKYIYFTASTNTGLNNTSLDMSSYERPETQSIYITLLAKDTENPFLPESDEEEVKSEDEEKKDEDSDEEKSDEDEGVKVVIDWENIDQRILSLDIGDGEYYGLECDESGKLFYMENDDNGNILHSYDIDEQEDKKFLSGIYGFKISADKKHMIYQYSGRNFGIVKTSDSPELGDGKLDFSGMMVHIDPREEWKQIYRETWRLQRDYFYDEKMHGCDWDAKYQKYLPFLEYVGSRDDLTYLQAELMGELVIGHAYVWSGDVPEVKSVNVGLLGADYELKNDRYRINKVFSGLNWNPDLRAPLTEPGVDIKKHDYILAVNGHELTAKDNIYEYFQNLADKQVQLTINSKPSFDDARTVTVVPTKSDLGLRFRNWVESNREYVDEKTDGKAAYVYMPNTAWQGYVSFNRYYFAQLDKKGVILDERWNGGGSTADYVIDLLDRPLFNWWITRNGQPWSTPFASIHGPKVMLINENAGSGGDAMPYYFRLAGLGKLIGKRTWGGLVGISEVPALIDGGGCTVPMFGIYSADGQWVVENQGIEPDITVEMLPKELIKGNDPQLDKAIEVILEEMKSYDYPADPGEPERPKRAAKWE